MKTMEIDIGSVGDSVNESNLEAEEAGADNGANEGEPVVEVESGDVTEADAAEAVAEEKEPEKENSVARGA